MSITICVVDDDRVYRSLSKKILEKLNTENKVLLFEDGEKAFDFISKNKAERNILPDYIFLDINMPYMDGWDFLEEYKQLLPNIAKKVVIYVVSSSVLEKDKEKARKFSEVSGYLVKPVSREHFTKILAQSLNN